MLQALPDVPARSRRAGLLVATLALVVAFIGAFAAASAQAVPVGPISHLGNPGASPAIAYNPSTSQGLAVWTGPHLEGTGVYGRRVNASGGAASHVFRLSGSVPDREVTNPSVAYSPRSGKFFVTWGTLAPESGEPLIRTRALIASTGHLVGATPGTHDPARYAPDWARCYLSAPPTAVATHPVSGEFLLTYGCKEDLYSSSIRGQRMNPDGGPLGTAQEYLSTGVVGTGSDRLHAVAANPRTGAFLVAAINGARGDDYDPRVVVRDVGPTGAPLGEQRTISERGSVGQTSVVAHPRTGEFLVVWASEDRLRSQRLSSAGAEVGVNDLTVFEASFSSYSTSAAVTVNLRSRQYLAVRGDERGVLVRPLRADGALLEAGATPIPRSATAAVAAASAPSAANFVVGWDGVFAGAVGTAP